MGLLCFTGINAAAQTYSVLHHFTTGASYPQGGLTVSGETLYGTTTRNGSGSSGRGTVFKVGADGGSITYLKSWDFNVDDGAVPKGELVLSEATLYGTTQYSYPSPPSGDGTVFKLNINGTGFTVLHRFAGNDGSQPVAGLVLAGSTLYGTTDQGGSSNCGTVFSLNTDGSAFTVLKHFTGIDGRYPQAKLVLSGTALYGTTTECLSGYGTVFKLNTDGSGFEVLKTLTTSEAKWPLAGLVLSGATLYGTTGYGGASDCGAVFKLNTDGSSFAVLKTFTGNDGMYPQAALQLNEGQLFGTTFYGGVEYQPTAYSGKGTVFRLNLDGSGFQVLKLFNGADGQWPFGCLTASSTNLYGTTCGGGSSNFGTVFKLTSSLAPRITASPLSLTTLVGRTVSFAVESLGAPPLAYQWWHDGTSLGTAATNALLQLTNIQVSQAGTYVVVVTNAFGAVTSAPAMLQVETIPVTTLTTCTEGVLRAALQWATNVTFACDGTIALSGPLDLAHSTTIDGGAYRVVLSGNNTGRVFSVSTNLSLALLNLTLANGRSEAGGAILNNGVVRATNCVFSGNIASNWPALVNSGGAVHNAGLFVASHCAFRQNQAVGFGGYVYSPDPAGSDSQGGAICNLGEVFIDNSDFVGNNARGGVGANGYSMAGTQVGDGGPGSSGGSGYGGAIFNAGLATLVNSTLVSNTCTGGEGGRGGSAAFYYTHGNWYYLGRGGNGGGGGSGLGSGVYSVGSAAKLTNCTVSRNSASAGVGGSGGLGTSSGAQGTNGIATGGIHASMNSSLVNTLLATNAPGNGSGNLADLGHNLSSDGSCAFTNSGSLNSTDPKLGLLADNGGPTLTMALLPHSPAIDAGDTAAAPPTDQRSVARPFGLAADIGAYEFALRLEISRAQSNVLHLLACDASGPTCWLLTSTNLADWQCVATNQIGTNGMALFPDNCVLGETQRFYRVVLPRPATARD